MIVPIEEPINDPTWLSAAGPQELRNDLMRKSASQPFSWRGGGGRHGNWGKKNSRSICCIYVAAGLYLSWHAQGLRPNSEKKKGNTGTDFARSWLPTSESLVEFIFDTLTGVTDALLTSVVAPVSQFEITAQLTLTLLN